MQAAVPGSARDMKIAAADCALIKIVAAAAAGVPDVLVCQCICALARRRRGPGPIARPGARPGASTIQRWQSGTRVVVCRLCFTTA